MSFAEYVLDVVARLSLELFLEFPTHVVHSSTYNDITSLFPTHVVHSSTYNDITSLSQLTWFIHQRTMTSPLSLRAMRFLWYIVFSYFCQTMAVSAAIFMMFLIIVIIASSSSAAASALSITTTATTITTNPTLPTGTTIIFAISHDPQHNHLRQHSYHRINWKTFHLCHTLQHCNMFAITSTTTITNTSALTRCLRHSYQVHSGVAGTHVLRIDRFMGPTTTSYGFTVRGWSLDMQPVPETITPSTVTTGTFSYPDQTLMYVQCASPLFLFLFFLCLYIYDVGRIT